ncbi:MAG: addiction module antidote protein [Methylococcus sp.]
MSIQRYTWDVTRHLTTDEDIAAYLEAAFEEAGDDAAFIAKALGEIARARGLNQLARDSGLEHESLREALSGEGNPSFSVILKVMHALRLKVHVEPETGRA